MSRSLCYILSYGLLTAQIIGEYRNGDHHEKGTD
jgi:hypothetical protein